MKKFVAIPDWKFCRKEEHTMKLAGFFRNAPKVKMPWQLYCKREKYSDLKPSLVENGRVLKRTIFQKSGLGSITYLWLSPGAKIAKHRHIKDAEWYVGWNGKRKSVKCEGCTQMEEHELENLSKHRWLFVLSIKFDLHKG